MGAARIGVACSDPDAILATPVETVRRDRSGKHLRGWLRWPPSWRRSRWCEGPGMLSDRIGRSKIILAGCRRVSPTPVRLADERLTTVSAQRSLRQAGVRASEQRAVIDQAAAVAILQLVDVSRRRELDADGGHRHRAQPVSVRPNRHRRTRVSRAQRRHAQQIRRRRRVAGGFALSLLVVVVVVAVVVGAKLWQTMLGFGNDYTGPGKRDIVIQIRAGDSTTAVGETLLKHGVVATVRAFVDAAHGNTAISSIQPGFYRMRTEISAASAVARLTDPHNRVGKLVIPEGRQLDDTTDMKTNVVNPGIFALISRATCVDLDGTQRCVSVADLRAAASRSTPTMLSVPRWAVGPVMELGTDHRRIEGLIAPGTFNIDPSASAETILATLISAGAVEYMKSGLVDTAKSLGLSPYDILVVASLVQQEANTQDFPKVARVIYNRLHEHRTLEFDSTVNYPLDRREVATSDTDRAQRTPWNTYMAQGLPATAICSPGVDALRAAEHPVPGDWLYFVTIDSQGTTLFTRDYQQHLANIELAKHNGVLDSAR
ncbi:hypothetical protein J113_17820 [Mycobacterium tuberculosis CAS/NITR204]|uniref:Endolytic murein transglycosylase n=18 Tax=Bacillati TaxID=1783272 RepID=R4MB00_MYCTX|nr:hypothetical protein J113_17820 [Mycobacterium tuberculosis CAS/NITR204]